MKIENLFPIFAPMPPAVVIGAHLYKEVIAATSAEWWIVASAAALFGTIGTIGAEMYSYKMALRALAEREKGAFFVALFGALVTSGLITWAVWRSDDSRPLVVAVAVAIVAYMISGLQDYLTTKNKRRQATTDNTLAQLAAQAELEKQRAKIASAQARQAKAEAGQVSTGQRKVSTVSTMDTRQALKPEVLQAVKAHIEANQGCSDRDIAKAVKISPTTAGKYRKAVQQKSDIIS